MSVVKNSDAALQPLRERILAAGRAGTPLVIRGHGSKAGLAPDAARPADGAEPLDLTLLSGISAHEPSELVVTVRAGTPIDVLEAALAAEGQHLAFEPPRLQTPGARGRGTVGGMVASGLSGPARMAAGSVRDHVLGVTMLDGRGELLSFGGQVMKNVAGYDVSRLFAGSLGTLGVILEVSLKVLPLPPATRTLRFACSQDEAIERFNRLAGQPLPLSAGVWWQGESTLRLAGARAAVEAAATRLGGEVLPEEAARVFWEDVREQRLPAWKLQEGEVLWRLALPPTTPAWADAEDALVEWGGGLRWRRRPAADDSWFERARAVGGHAMRWRGARTGERVFAPRGAAERAIEARLKAAFDPDGVFARRLPLE